MSECVEACLDDHIELFNQYSDNLIEHAKSLEARIEALEKEQSAWRKFTDEANRTLEAADKKIATQQARIESLTEGIKRTTALYNDLENAEIEGDDESCGVIRHQLDRSIEDMAALLEEGE